VVLGGTGGIGSATVRALLAAGTRVLATGRSEERLDVLRAAGAAAIALDLADPKAPGLLAQGVAEHLGDSLDGLVATTGSHGPIGPTRAVDLAALRRSLDENLIGVLGCIQSLAPALDRASQPSIVLLSGGGATGPRPNYAAYSIAKVATVRIAETLAIEEPNWRVNAVAPGYVATSIHDDTGETPPATAVAADVPAQLIVKLLSPEATGVTGRLISAPWDRWRDDGWAAGLRDDPSFGRLRRVDGELIVDTEYETSLKQSLEARR
jgi:NAD(P)-dependent dehydrogenase (short-subunit alcohol dehydrogenase family)